MDPEGAASDAVKFSDRQEAIERLHPGDTLDPASELKVVLAELRAREEEVRLRLATLERSLRLLDQRTSALENSLLFRLFRRVGTFAQERRARLGQFLLRSPVQRLYLTAFGHRAWNEYDAWVAQQRSRRPPLDWHQERAQRFRRCPLFSILLAVHNPVQEWLEAAIRSVREQVYPKWELCLCDDASREPWVGDYLAAQAAADPRVRLVRSSNPLGMSGALNCAGSISQGDYVVLLGQHDVLSSYLLYHLAEYLEHVDADLIYTDEDQLDEAGRRVAPIFKPDWSPDLLTSCMYIGHCLAVSRQALERVGWFRSEYDGAQDYDLALRLTDSAATVGHIPHVLYHWRKHADSTSARSASKPYAHSAGRRVLEDAIRRRGWQATVEDGAEPHVYRLRWHIIGQPRVSLVICSRNPRLLESCLRAIDKITAYQNRELVIVQHRTGDDSQMDKLLAIVSCERVRHEGPFNFGEMNNRGAAIATGEILVFLNDDVKPLTPEWLSSLVGQAQRPHVGVVGAKLLYSSRTTQHAGIVVGMMDGCGHPLRHTCGSRYWIWHDCTRNVSAVTGACLAIRKKVFEELQGFDVTFPLNYGDVDLCLRARRAGYEVIYEPSAVLEHRECATRRAGTQHEERDLWFRRWGELLTKGDPFYNPNLTVVREDGSLNLNPA